MIVTRAPCRGRDAHLILFITFCGAHALAFDADLLANTVVADDLDHGPTATAGSHALAQALCDVANAILEREKKTSLSNAKIEAHNIHFTIIDPAPISHPGAAAQATWHDYLFLEIYAAAATQSAATGRPAAARATRRSPAHHIVSTLVCDDWWYSARRNFACIFAP